MLHTSRWLPLQWPQPWMDEMDLKTSRGLKMLPYLFFFSFSGDEDLNKNAILLLKARYKSIVDDGVGTESVLKSRTFLPALNFTIIALLLQR